MIEGDKLPDRHDCDSWRSVATLVAIIAMMIVADQVLWPSFAKRMLQKAKQTELQQSGTPYMQGMLTVDDEVAIAAQLLAPELAQHALAPEEPCFVSLDPGAVTNGKRVWREPPQALLDALSNPEKRALNLHSCAAMTERDGAIVDAGSGKPGTVYYVHFKRKLGENRFLLEAVRYSSGNGTGSVEYIATRGVSGWTYEATGVAKVS